MVKSLISWGKQSIKLRGGPLNAGLGPQHKSHIHEADPKFKELCDRSFWNLSGLLLSTFFFFLKKKLLIHLSRVLVVACRILNAAHELLAIACVSTFLTSDWTNGRWSHSHLPTREVPGYFSFAKWLLTYGLSRFFSFCIYFQLFSVYFSFFALHLDS